MDTRIEARSRPHRIWLWAIAILVSLPVGGYVADLVVDGVDSLGAALAGGLIAGAIFGAAEWFALRQWVSWRWISTSGSPANASPTSPASTSSERVVNKRRSTRTNGSVS